jgi:hypothetical protein
MADSKEDILPGNKPLSPKVLKRLREILGEPFIVASGAVTYAEVKSLSYKYKGMAEFRDALTHVGRAISIQDEKKAISELDTAFEHIRRGGVESMQEYVEAKYVDILPRISISEMKCRLVGIRPPNKRKIHEANLLIKDTLSKAREAKPHRRWRKSIELL